MTVTPTTVQYTKWGGALHWRHDTVRLGEDEFEEHAQVLSYPPEIVEATRATALQLVNQIKTRAEPFGTAAEHWLGELTDF
ncbi:MAG: hypothetical protein GY713_21185 [Actinomycetia bacterium]|nr:hypothetical protein [Actinomycetes bacterium]